METAKFNEAQRAMYDLCKISGLSERAATEAATDWLANDNVPAGYAPADVMLSSRRNGTFQDQLAEAEAALAEANRLLAEIDRNAAYGKVADRIVQRVRNDVQALERERRTAGVRGTASAPIREVSPPVAAGNVELREHGEIVDADAEVEAILKDWRQSYTGPNY